MTAAKVRTDKFVAGVCRADYYQFFREFWPTVSEERFVPNWHVEKLCRELQESAERVFRGEHKDHDTVWNQPPGTTKSKAASVLLQPWAWTRMPSCRFITGSYSERLSLDLARQSRDVVTSDKYRALFPEIKLREDQNTKGFFMNTRAGWRFSTGVGGTVTGMHAHFIVIDDPIDPLGAMSSLVIEEANTWIMETLSDRKVDKLLTPTWLIMQRLHQDDPAGRWLYRGGRVRHVCLPCDDTWEVKPAAWRVHYAAGGGLLDPVRLSRAALEEAEARGEAYYSGQYGQSPVPRGGALFKVARLIYRPASAVPVAWKKPPLRYWDKAATAGGKGAYTAGVKGGIDPEGFEWVLDVVRGRWDSGDREGVILATARRDGKPVRVGVEQEPAGSGKESAESTLKRLADAGFSCYADPARGDKELRADPFSVEVNLGKVIVVLAPWNSEYVEEMRYFPRGRFKDQIDASSGMHAGLAKRRYKIGAWRGGGG